MRKSYVRDLWDWRKEVNRLQKVSSETEKTSKACTGHGEGLASTGSWDCGCAWGALDGGGTDGSTVGRGWCSSWCRGGGVGVNWSSWSGGWGNNSRGSIDWLADGTWAVGDDNGGALSQGVGVSNAVEGDGRAGRADGGIDINDLSHV